MRTERLCVLVLVALNLACSSGGAIGNEPAGGCADGKCDGISDDEVPLETPCDHVLIDRSGRGFLPARLAHDPLVAKVYMDEANGCPVTYEGIVAALAQTDASGCAVGTQTRVISEQAQLAGKSEGASYRVVSSRTCGGRDRFGLMFSLTGFAGGSEGGLDVDGTEFPAGVEIIGFERENAVFNFYKEVDGKMGFFGSSTDYVTLGPAGPEPTDVRGCGNCHRGGGLIMKELTFPWVHWHGRFQTPDADTLVGRRPELGELVEAKTLEQRVVEPGNARWNRRRVDFLLTEGTAAQLLAPLFCPVELNVASTNRKDRVQDPLLVDSDLLQRVGANSTRISLVAAHHDRILAAIEQNVPGTEERDLVAPMTFIARAFADIDHVDALIEAGVIDEELAVDVLMVDFTRPVFSDDRCDLLQLVPALDPDDRTADEIRAGLLDALRDADEGSAAAQLRAHLQAHDDGRRFDHRGTVAGFLAACRARQASDRVQVSGKSTSAFHADVLKLRSLGRKIAFFDGVVDDLAGSAAHPFKLFEFADSMPVDRIEVRTSADAAALDEIHPQARLSPLDCELVSELVPIPQDHAGAGGDVDQPTSCKDRCGVFDPANDCQCNPACADAGDCCPDFLFVCL